MRRPVIVTRPAAAGERLTAALRARGHEVAWWPAFEIAPPPDEPAVRAALARLADYDLALFVSPNAVHAVAARLTADWPPATVLGAVGAGTRAAALAELRGARAATVVAPDDADTSGSESFWRTWQASGRRARRVLLLRAASGRDWIVDRLRGVHAEVDALAVYDRRPHRLPEAELARLRGWVAQRRAPVAVVSSAEAVGAVLEQVRAADGGADWLRGGVAIATHPRIAERLRSSGFDRVEACAAADGDVIGTLESITD
jgi:uroporphyrinogen-III synthase